VCSGSYYGRERIFELLVITDQNSYRLDCFNGILTFGTGEQIAAPWEENCARVTQDFLAAVRQKSTPAISGSSVLAAKQVLQVIQTKWDHRYGIRGLPGRPLHEV
jgi:2-hydroxy-4-carboxymuconate semialdehyde hemiacetal dehydrogenase